MKCLLARLRAGSRRALGLGLASSLLVFVMVAVVAAVGSTARAAGTYSIVDLGTLGGGYSDGSAINNNGQVAGISETADGQPHCFTWTEAGGMVDLGFCNGLVRGINSSGHVVGMRAQLPESVGGAPRLYVFRTCGHTIEQLKSAPVAVDGVAAGEAVDPKWESSHGHAHAALRYGAMSRPSPSVLSPDPPPPMRSLAGVEELRKLYGRTDRRGRYEY